MNTTKEETAFKGCIDRVLMDCSKPDGNIPEVSKYMTTILSILEVANMRKNWDGPTNIGK